MFSGLRGVQTCQMYNPTSPDKILIDMTVMLNALGGSLFCQIIAVGACAGVTVTPSCSAYAELHTLSSGAQCRFEMDR